MSGHVKNIIIIYFCDKKLNFFIVPKKMDFNTPYV